MHSHTPLFQLTTRNHRLRARGVAAELDPAAWTGKNVAQAAASLLAAAGRDSAETPLLVGAIPFDPSSPARLYVPEQVEWGPGTITQPELPAVDSDDRTDLPEDFGDLVVEGSENLSYCQAVEDAVERIQAGEASKVVLARQMRIRTAQPFDPDALYPALVRQNPYAYSFRMDTDGGTLLGATPELVLGSDRSGRVDSFPLAGSTPRHDDVVRDSTAAYRLLTSDKNLEEHGYVARAVETTMEEFADFVEAPSLPELVQTPRLWHLGSRITGRLREGRSALELLYALHPTPAVCGSPTAAAQRMIAELEDFDRGFFSGLIGWQDAEGNGEWALTLRCGLVDNRTATLYAAAGIVGGSIAAAEHEETAVKMSTFAKALGVSDLSAARAVPAS